MDRSRTPQRGLLDQVVTVGAVRQDELEAYYSACDGLLMPSRLESFSASYLEAMHFGIPILTSDRDFAHDICGDAALYFDPTEIESMKAAVIELISRPDLRRELVARGRDRSATAYARSWDDIACIIRTNLELVAQGATLPADGDPA